MKVTFEDRIARTGKIKVGAAAVIFSPDGEKILLTRRTDNGQWCLPGGGMDPGESISETVIREVWEETGLHVEIEKLIGVYTNPHMLIEYEDGNRWHLVAFTFQTRVTGGQLGLSNETTEVDYFTPAEITELDLLPQHRQRIADILEQQPMPFIR